MASSRCRRFARAQRCAPPWASTERARIARASSSTRRGACSSGPSIVLAIALVGRGAPPVKSVRILRRRQGSRARSPAGGAAGQGWFETAARSHTIVRGPPVTRARSTIRAARGRRRPFEGTTNDLEQENGSGGRPGRSPRAASFRSSSSSRPLAVGPECASARQRVLPRGPPEDAARSILANERKCPGMPFANGSHGPRPCAGPRWRPRHVRVSPVAARPARGPTPSRRCGPSLCGGAQVVRLRFPGDRLIPRLAPPDERRERVRGSRSSGPTGSCRPRSR